MTVAKIHILSFMKDIIDAKLSSMEDKTYKKAFIGRILISQKLCGRELAQYFDFATMRMARLDLTVPVLL